MNKVLRKLSVILGFIILFGGIYVASKIGNPSPKEAAGKAPPTDKLKVNYVNAMIAKNETLSSEVIISGKIIARQKIDLFSEVTGHLNKAGKEFREGITFKSGELMLTLDKTEAELEIKASKSQLYSSLIALLPDLETDYADNFSTWKNYIDAYDINKPIQDLPISKSSREKLYIGARNIENQFLNIKRQEFRLTKYKIHAPFDGVLSNTVIYEGALVRSGQKLGEFTHPSRYELEASISLYDLPFFRTGNNVKLFSEATKQEWTGVVARLGKTIDEKTQSQKVFITVNSADLNEGMLLNGRISTKEIPDVVSIPRKLLINNKQIYIIQDGKLALKTVEVVKVDMNEMYVKGIADQTLILGMAVLGAYEGMSVQVIE